MTKPAAPSPDRRVVRHAMEILLETAAPPSADLEERLARTHPGLESGQARAVLSHCSHAVLAAKTCAEQVEEGRLTPERAIACLAEQFPDLDTDQLRLAIDRGRSVKGGA